MILTNIHALAEKLRTNSLPESEQLKYYIGVSVLGVLSFATTQTDNPVFGSTLAHFIVQIIQIAAVIITLTCAYNWNKKGDGKDFVARSVCISFPLTINLIIFSLISIIPIFLIIILGNHLIAPVRIEKLRLLSSVCMFTPHISMGFIYYFYSVKWIRYVSGENNELATLDKQALWKSIAVVVATSIFLFAIGFIDYLVRL